MAVTHSAAAREDMADAIAALCNAGSQCTLVIGTSSLSGETGVLVKIDLDDFTVSAAVATSASDTNSGTATGTGTAALAEVRDDPTGSVVFSGSVGVGTGDVQISSTSIATGDTISLTSDVTWTAPS